MVKMAICISSFNAVFALLFSTMMTVSSGEEDRCVYPTDNIPYITFMGQRLPNHSYLDIAQLEQNSTLECHTDLSTCCDPAADGEVVHTGEWVLPNGQPAESFDEEFKVSGFSQQVDLVYKGEPATTGIFRCDVPTTAAHDTGNTARLSVYIGVYSSDGLYIDDTELTVNSDLNGPNPQFTITCYSFGGPVGCVVWRREKKLISNPNATSTLIDAVTGHYEHNLTVTGNVGGGYSCSVANDKPASEYEGVYIQTGDQPLNLSAIQDGPTSLHIYWVKPVIKKTIGYRIYYSGGSTGYVDIDDPQVDNYLLTGLKNNVTYHISIAGRSNHLPSYRLNYTTQLVPGVPELRIFSATDNTLSVSWTTPNGSKVDKFEIQWERFVGSTSASFRDTLSPRSNNYTVTGLKGYDNATFSVSVTAYNAAGSSTSSRVNVAANFAYGNTLSMNEGGTTSSSSDGGNNEAVIGGIVAGFVILAIAVVVVAILVYHYKLKSKKNKPTAVYSLAGPAVSSALSPTAPPTLPPPRLDIRTVNNRSYTPSGPNETDAYYTPMAYTYPNMGPQSQPRPAPRTNVNNNATDTGATAESFGHGYDYITVEK